MVGAFYNKYIEVISIILYHVSTSLRHTGHFTPRVPEFLDNLDFEDWTTPRICFSDTIEGCLGSMPDGGRGLDKFFERVNPDRTLRVFWVDTDELKQRVMTPEEIEDKVPDALIHREYWILDEIYIPTSYIIRVNSFDVDIEIDKISNLKYELLLG